MGTVFVGLGTVQENPTLSICTCGEHYVPYTYIGRAWHKILYNFDQFISHVSQTQLMK